MNTRFLNISALSLIIIALSGFLSSCSDNDPEVRTASDLKGVWSETPGHYLYIESSSRIFSLYIETLEDEGTTEEVGTLEQDGYFYEPGYSFIFYMNRKNEPDIFQLMSISHEEMVWCLVDDLSDDKYKNMSKTEILGAVLKEADKGFKTDPKNYITFTRVDDSEFQEILDKYGVEIPE